jgi:CTP synthase (UTP-ammonia lyase)
MNCALIALVGDYSEAVPAHRAIPRALELAKAAAGKEMAWRWIHTSEIHEAARVLADCAAVWAVPASPYANMKGVLDAIRWARESGKPFLGTCGGFQHAVIEFARNVAALPDADHAESNPDADLLVITRLNCSLVEKTDTVRFTPGSRLRAAYGSDTACEGYRCNYGLNPAHRLALEAGGLRFTAFDDSGEIRGFELPTHPFFIGTLFQPECAALRGETAPVVNALVRALG